ncbi:MAG: glycosyltransferase [Alkaliphilus sp.]
MKRFIYLLGEYSGLYTNLKKGLEELGHKAILVSSGDGFKNITGDVNISFKNSSNRIARNVSRGFSTYGVVKGLNIGADDIVQIIGLNFFSLGFAGRMAKQLRGATDNFYLTAAGGGYKDFGFFGKLDYSPYQDIEKSLNFYMKQSLYYYLDSAVIKHVKKIIPCTYSYAGAYRESEYSNKVTKTLPFPIDTNKIRYAPQRIENNRLKIFHGLNRESIKGTKYIREAMLRIERKYPNDVEILIDGRMSLNKYLKVLEEANIVIDQALSYEYGMNALYSMALGKVVLSGNELECQRELERTDIPVINITPSADDIYNKLEKLVLDKKSVEEIGYNSRKFVEDFHHHVKVAKKYIDTWNSIEGNR